MDQEDRPEEEVPSVKPHFGSAVEGAQRFPRPHLEQSLIQLLKSSNGVCMFGLRRTGKSTLTRFVRDALKDYTVVEVDAQGFRTLDHLLSGIFRALPGEHGLVRWLSEWVTGKGAVPAALRTGLKLAVHGLGVDDATTSATITAYWQAIADQVARSLRQDRPAILLSIDEFPWMCEGIIAREGSDRGRTTVNQLLASLRLWRDAGQDAADRLLWHGGARAPVPAGSRASERHAAVQRATAWRSRSEGAGTLHPSACSRLS